MDVDSKRGLSAPLETGDWAGWSVWLDDEPYENYVGPFYTKRDDDGRMICGCRVQPKNLRAGAVSHGGFLVSFADYSLFLIAQDEIGVQDGVTLSLTTDFLAPAPAGALLIASGDVLRRGRSLMFMRGIIRADGVAVLAFSGVIKLLSKPFGDGAAAG